MTTLDHDAYILAWWLVQPLQALLVEPQAPLAANEWDNDLDEPTIGGES